MFQVFCWAEVSQFPTGKVSVCWSMGELVNCSKAPQGNHQPIEDNLIKINKYNSLTAKHLLFYNEYLDEKVNCIKAEGVRVCCIVEANSVQFHRHGLENWDVSEHCTVEQGVQEPYI